MKKPTICFFGSYNQTHRNNSLRAGLESHGYQVISCRDSGSRLVRYLRLCYRLWRLRAQYDVLFIGFPNHGLVPLARLITNKPIIFDPFISLYNTIVEDRQMQSKYSPRATIAFFKDRFALQAAHHVLADTTAHADYYAKTFAVSRDKFVVVPVGADNTQFIPQPQTTKGPFVVAFYGTYSPLQGVQYIIEAARTLSDNKSIIFKLVGHGQTLQAVQDLVARYKLTNVEFITERIPLTELVQFLASADVSLGIFGGTVKTNMVIPHKVYDALALGKPVITARTAATREFFVDGEHVVLCNDADGADLAAKILQLHTDNELRTHVAKNGHALFLSRFTPSQIVKKLLPILETYA